VKVSEPSFSSLRAEYFKLLSLSLFSFLFLVASRGLFPVSSGTSLSGTRLVHFDNSPFPAQRLRTWYIPSSRGDYSVGFLFFLSSDCVLVAWRVVLIFTDEFPLPLFSFFFPFPFG